jgi:hypothetical protein
MKIEYLKDRVADYKASIETVVTKKTYWNEHSRPLIVSTLKEVVSSYKLGWKVQELDWIYNNEAVNITFDSFPLDLIDRTNKIPAFQFIPGAALVFSQSYNGQVFVFVLFPEIETVEVDTTMVKMGIFSPQEITRKLIIEKVDAFLKEMINWEVPSVTKKLGY